MAQIPQIPFYSRLEITYRRYLTDALPGIIAEFLLIYSFWDLKEVFSFITQQDVAVVITLAIVFLVFSPALGILLSLSSYAVLNWLIDKVIEWRHPFVGLKETYQRLSRGIGLRGVMNQGNVWLESLEPTLQAHQPDIWEKIERYDGGKILARDLSLFMVILIPIMILVRGQVLFNNVHGTWVFLLFLSIVFFFLSVEAEIFTEKQIIKSGYAILGTPGSEALRKALDD